MGLREEKKRALRINIERTTLKLINKHGYDGATVEDICTEAGVASNKTFFNYFPGKAAALTGRTLHLPSANELLETLEARPDESYFDILAGLLTEQAALVTDDKEVAPLRRKVFKKSPQLFFRVDEGLREVQFAVMDAVKALLIAYPERSLVPGADPTREAFVAASCTGSLACIGAMLATTGDTELSTTDVRRLVSGYLAAGAESNPTALEDGAGADWAKPLMQ